MWKKVATSETLDRLKELVRLEALKTLDRLGELVRLNALNRLALRLPLKLSAYASKSRDLRAREKGALAAAARARFA